MKQVDVLILTWHQVYLSSNAGGYIRLKEFLKRIPKTLSFRILDNKPSLYNDIVDPQNLIIYNTPKFLETVRKYAFLPWLLLETIFSGITIYNISSKIISNNKVKVVYIPIGEFQQLYLPGIFLKRKFPHIKLIVDILNYELPDDNVSAYFKRLRKSGVGMFRALVTICMFSIGYWVTNTTLPVIDYIFTVSPDLVTKIQKAYKKNTIDFTPSGVDTKRAVVSKKKKYLGVYVGRITTQKGIMDLIDVWTEVVKQKRDALLAIAGHADESLLQNLKKELQKRKLTNNISFLGQVSEEEKFQVLSESEIFLHLARYEPLFPVIGILEGLASGLYTIVYDMPVVDSQKRDLKSKKSLAIIENGNIHQAAQAVIDYEQLTRERKKQKAQEAKKNAELFSWDSIAQKEFAILKKFIEKASKYD